MKKNEITKGLRVRAKGYVLSGYSPYCNQDDKSFTVVYEPITNDKALLVRSLYRFEFNEPFEGIIVGTSHRVTGLCDDSVARYGTPNPKQLSCEKRHFVVMVQPTHTLKYQKPKAVLLEDLELDTGRDMRDSDNFVDVAASLDQSQRDKLSMMLFDVARSGADQVTLSPIHLKFLIGTGLAAMRTTAEMIRIFRTFPVDGDGPAMLDWYNRKIKAKLNGLNKIMGE